MLLASSVQLSSIFCQKADPAKCKKKPVIREKYMSCKLKMGVFNVQKITDNFPVTLLYVKPEQTILRSLQLVSIQGVKICNTIARKYSMSGHFPKR